ncbi:MAG TPA: 30S ribosomal protein S6 [Phycisphaerae bacterium]|nr:30S ribosomal protein S6 [Phycisphaerae bacterium]HPS52980.1 30S ribosomal protein S6 [Phycisphaerae bacterium]
MEQRINTYEAMFLLDPGQMNFEAACQPINRVFERNGAEVLQLKLWDERKLAYEIKNRKRGLYVISYFKMDTANVQALERDCMLSDEIIRVLVIRKDRLTEEEMNAETPAETAANAPVEFSGSDYANEQSDDQEDDTVSVDDAVEE